MGEKNLPGAGSVETSALKIYWRLLAYLKPYRAMFIVSGLGFALSALSTTLFLKILENLIEVIDAHNPQDRFLVPLQVIGVTLLRGIGAFAGVYFLSRVAFLIVHNLRVQVFNHM